ncbi:MAG: SGNH/GDSL hydrolase family protein [Planctomycetes bacterium]|nr:SGNH/GDSL hydrolase family protein [Planctomycetota bacterium]
MSPDSDADGSSPTVARIARLIDANIAATHAFQVLRARKAGTTDSDFTRGAPTSGVLEELVARQASLLSADPIALKAWAEGHPSSFDPSSDLDRIAAAAIRIPESAPVAVFSRWLSAAAPTARDEQIRAIASLHQTVMEVDRDGTLLQQQFRSYIALGLPVFVGQLGLPGDDACLLRMGDVLSPLTTNCPFGTSPAEWQIAGRKIWNWGEKHLHLRDDRVIADEMLREPAVQALLPAIRSLAAQRIVVIGHSFTAGAHWASPSSFVAIATAVLARENPRVEVQQHASGNLSPTQAEEMFLPAALAWKPQVALLALLMWNDADYQALQRMLGAFTAARTRVIIFDDLLIPMEADGVAVERRARLVREAGGTVIGVGSMLKGSPQRGSFLSLDGIHMTESYHRIMAHAWLTALARTGISRSGSGSSW